MGKLKYGFERKLVGTSFEDAVGKVTKALETEGFGILTKIDIKETLKRKLDAELRNYMILGACNPSLAHEAIRAEAQMGLLLPCNVVVQEAPEGEGIVVSIIDPKAMFMLVDNASAKPIAEEAERRLRRVIESLG